jgi:uncharacterized protein YegL
MEWHFVIIDRSGSMISKIDDVVTGYKDLLKEQKDNYTARLTVFTFSNTTTEIYDGKMNEAEELLLSQIIPTGGTALIDSVGTAYTKIIDSKESYTKISIHVLTDGIENSSVLYSSASLESIKNSILRTQEIELFFIGADSECIKHSNSIKPNYITNCTEDFKVAFRQVSRTISGVSPCEKGSQSGTIEGGEHSGPISMRSVENNLPNTLFNNKGYRSPVSPCSSEPRRQHSGLAPPLLRRSTPIQ